MIHEPFSEPSLAAHWIVLAPKEAGALATVDRGAVALHLPAGSESEIVLRRTLDVVSARGQRVRLTARIRTDGAANATAHTSLTVMTTSPNPTYRDVARTSPIHADTWTTVHTVVDIAPDATTSQLDLIWNGAGTAWFSDVELAVIGASPPPAPIELSPQQLASLVAFTRAAALVRYLHPSDEAANLDWNAFYPTAIARLLRVTEPAQLPEALRALFQGIAPTVTFTRDVSLPPTLPPRGDGTHLARWHRHGLGNAPPFLTYREGRDPDPSSASASTHVASVKLNGCKQLVFRTDAHKLPGPGRVEMFAQVLQPGDKEQDTAEPLPEASEGFSFTVSLASDTQNVVIGLRVTGASGVTMSTLTAACDGGAPQTIDLARSQWKYFDDEDLYTWRVDTCDGSACVKLARTPSGDEIDPRVDVVHRELGDSLTMHMPLAVWANAARTLPVATHDVLLDDFAIADAPTRLAAIAGAWGTASLFYPYFADQAIDWQSVLPDALREAAAARSPRATQAALAHMLTHLRDNHLKITHPGASIAGILPVQFRKLDGHIIVNGGLPLYLATIPIGSELLALDDEPADQAYARSSAETPAATPGLHDYLTPARMVMGPIGELRRLRVRAPDGRVADHVLPLVSDELYGHQNRELRPTNGHELAAGIYYLDLDALPMAVWKQLQPTLEQAKGLVIDLRGYITQASFELLSHLIDHSVSSPTWQTPIVPPQRDLKFLTGSWQIRPQAPRFSAKVVVLIDGRTMSAAETVLQLFREAHAGVVVGETSSGANGNACYAEVPGGFTFRFTGMRAGNPDGSTAQGRGFAPDQVIHPTLAGIRAGRDEILEVGIATVQRLITP
jgi:hypothetical protein